MKPKSIGIANKNANKKLTADPPRPVLAAMLTTGSAPHPTPEADDSSSDCSSSPPSPSLPQPKSSLLVHCPKDAKPGTLLKTTTSTVPNTSQRSNTKYFHNTVRQHKIRKTSQYIAVPHGIQPGDQFHVPQPLTNSAVKEVLMANTAVTSDFDLEVTRSLVMQEVQGTFVTLKTPPSSSILSNCFQIIQCCAGTSCLHPFCFGFGCSSLAGNASFTGREFLFKDGHDNHNSSANNYLYLVKERSRNRCCSLRRICNPNHSLMLEAYRVLPLSNAPADIENGLNTMNMSQLKQQASALNALHKGSVRNVHKLKANKDETVLRTLIREAECLRRDRESQEILRPDIKRGPEFTIVRQGHCLLSCCACLKECKHRYEVYDRNVSPGVVKPGNLIGLGYQQTCGQSLCTDCTPEALCCCTPTVAVMRRDTVMTGNGWGSTDRVLGVLEGPCCCYDGLCCRSRSKHWYFSQTPGKSYDVGALMFSTLAKHAVPNAMLQHHTVGNPILMELTKRNLTTTDKKLMISTMVAMKYMFLRDWWSGVVCCNVHCCGATVQC